jgi:sigma-B regulation protein RsbU (phosphoserine phosphatase)
VTARTRLLELRFPAQPRELKAMREAVRERLLSEGAGEGCVRDVVMALDEACQNVIRHAYGPQRGGDIRLEIEREGDRLILSLVDFAPRVDPAKVKPRDLEDVRPGGLGTFLIRELMDSAEFVEPPPGCGNLLRMTRRLD